jgi:hypothetical protein
MSIVHWSRLPESNRIARDKRSSLRPFSASVTWGTQFEGLVVVDGPRACVPDGVPEMSFVQQGYDAAAGVLLRHFRVEAVAAASFDDVRNEANSPSESLSIRAIRCVPASL